MGIDKVMPYSGELFLAWFGRADIHSAVNQCGIDADDFDIAACLPPSQGQARFARSGGAAQRINRRRAQGINPGGRVLGNSIGGSVLAKSA